MTVIKREHVYHTWLTYPLQQLSLLGARQWFAQVGPIIDFGFKAASRIIDPPHFAAGAGCVVTGCAGVAGIIPFSSHLRKQRPEGVAYASLMARAAWTTPACVQRARACLPFMRPPLGATMANPVAQFVASAPDFVWVQAFFGVQL